MSYNFQVDAKDGVLTIADQVGQVPDGRYSVAGHDDEASRNISVSLTDGGQMVASASGFARRI